MKKKTIRIILYPRSPNTQKKMRVNCFLVTVLVFPSVFLVRVAFSDFPLRFSKIIRKNSSFYHKFSQNGLDARFSDSISLGGRKNEGKKNILALFMLFLWFGGNFSFLKRKLLAVSERLQKSHQISH